MAEDPLEKKAPDEGSASGERASSEGEATPAKQESRLRVFGKNAAVMLVSLLVAWLLIEIVMAVFGFDQTASIYTGDRDTGWALRPGAEGYQIGEAKQYVTINSDGLRDREHAVQKPADTLRIAVLGDSFSAALEVPQDKAYWAVLESKLGACLAPKKVEVINFGVGGFGQNHELMMLRSRAFKYQPDLVLLQVFLGNDIFNNSKELSKGSDPAVPFFQLAGDKLVLDDSFRGLPNLDQGHIDFVNFASDLMNHSRLALLIASSKKAMDRQGVATAVEGGKLDANDLDPGPKERPLFSAPTTPALIEAWQITEALLSLMNAEVKDKGASLWITTLSMQAQVFPDAAKRQALATKLGVPDLFYPDKRVREHAQKEGIPVVTLAPPMADYADQHHAFLHGFPTSAMGVGHWNEEGHRVGGELIAEAMCAALAQKKP